MKHFHKTDMQMIAMLLLNLSPVFSETFFIFIFIIMVNGPGTYSCILY
jgi:hypothetical protein